MYPENIRKKYFQRAYTADQNNVPKIKLPSLEKCRTFNIFLAYLGPVSISLMIADKSPVTVVLIVLAMFQGFLIHKLFMPARFLTQ